VKWQNLIFQFKVTLEEIEPVIWRRIQVPAKYSFWDLHVAIQDAMGWFDCHLHAFRFKPPHKKKVIEIGIPVDDFDDTDVRPSWEERVADRIWEPGKSMQYEYDVGDCWCHVISLEGILIKEKGTNYPRCLDGQRACPPEDCGGVWGYERMLKILGDKRHEEYESMIEWLSGWYGTYEPEAFMPEKVKFDNPLKRWKRAFTE
jgi:hypothetical protein